MIPGSLDPGDLSRVTSGILRCLGAWAARFGAPDAASHATKRLAATILQRMQYVRALARK